MIRDISSSIQPFYSLERPAGRAQSELHYGAGGTFTECILSEISTMKYAHKYSLLFKKIQKFLSTLMRDISTSLSPAKIKCLQFSSYSSMMCLFQSRIRSRKVFFNRKTLVVEISFFRNFNLVNFVGRPRAGPRIWRRNFLFFLGRPGAGPRIWEKKKTHYIYPISERGEYFCYSHDQSCPISVGIGAKRVLPPPK